jgi:hypothetical protein
MPAPKYQRLTRPRSRSSFAVRSFYSLWLGPDHLLSVNSTGYSEKYKRFYFRDIQVVTIQKNKRRLIWNWILSVPAILILARFGFGLAVKSDSSLTMIIFLALAAVIFGIPLFFNNLFGSTCSCQLRTAVQIEELPSLCRVPQTRKVLNKIRPLILAAQNGENSNPSKISDLSPPATEQF